MNAESRGRATQRLGTLDLARWAAAVAVVSFHSSMYLEHKPFGGILKAGYHGVDFFFVLSGFVIASAHLGDLGCRERAVGYIKKRFIRIYPPYWIALSLSLAWAYKHPYLQPLTPLNIAANFFLIPRSSVDYPFVIPAWTLHYELLFYFYFAFLIFIPRAVGYAALFAAPAVIWFLGVPLTTGTFPAAFFLSKVMLEFFFGVGAYIIQQWLGRRSAMALIAAGVAILALEAASDSLRTDRLHIPEPYGLAFAAVVGGMAAMEASLGSIRSELTDFLGQITYGTYLTHYTFLMVIVGTGALARLGPSDPSSACVLLIMASVIGGAVFYRLAERPLFSLFSRILQRPL